MTERKEYAYGIADLLKKAINKHHEGYDIIPDGSYRSGQGTYVLCYRDLEEQPLQEEIPTEDTKIDVENIRQVIEGMSDKDARDYIKSEASEYGIDLSGLDGRSKPEKFLQYISDGVVYD